MWNPFAPRIATIVAAVVFGACQSSATPTPTPFMTDPRPAPAPEGSPNQTSVATTPSPAAVAVITAIAAGGDHTCALTSRGGVRCWGSNSAGQLGNGEIAESATPWPVDVSGMSSGIGAISAGNGYGCALTVGGGVRCWGYNAYGQLGNDAGPEGIPVDVVGLTSGAAAVDVDGLSCALTTEGGVKCWGANNVGQLGNDSTTDSGAPVDVAGLARDVVAISAGGLHACALTAGGGVKCWGWNAYGQLGDGTTTDHGVPEDVAGLERGVRAIAAGQSHTCALLGSGGVRCWGANYDGELGSAATATVVPDPVEVEGLEGEVTAIAAGGRHTCALLSDGGVQCWGWNEQGQLGNGTTSNAAKPGAASVVGLADGTIALAAGRFHTCALTSSGGIMCWGDNYDGQLGTLSPTVSGVPLDVDLTATNRPPEPASAALPVRGPGRAIGLDVQMAQGPGGGVYVSIPAPDGSVLLALLDSTGSPRPGWPVLLDDATTCGQLLPVDDGSVRVVCRPDDLNMDLNSGVRAYAFGSTGRSLAGWPVDVWGYFTSGRVVSGDALVLFASRSLGDVVIENQPSMDGGLVTIDAEGRLTDGERVTRFDQCCNWVVGPEGVAFSVTAAGLTSRIHAIDETGLRAGWPVSFEGIGSGPSFGRDGRIVVTVGSFERRVSHVLQFGDAGSPVPVRSAELPIATGAHWDPGMGDGTFECGVPSPQPPILAEDGTIFVFSEVDTAIVALDASLAIKRGWPFEPSTPMVSRTDPTSGDLTCGSLALPAAGPDGSLYLPLQAASPSVGGSLVAVGQDGRVRSGWPVELNRPGSEFWSVVVGADGTTFALAVEPEGGDRASATILAIAPDSRVLWSTTIVEP